MRLLSALKCEIVIINNKNVTFFMQWNRKKKREYRFKSLENIEHELCSRAYARWFQTWSIDGLRTNKIVRWISRINLLMKRKMEKKPSNKSLFVDRLINEWYDERKAIRITWNRGNKMNECIKKKHHWHCVRIKPQYFDRI